MNLNIYVYQLLPYDAIMGNEMYGYARVSTKEQNLSRQLEQLKDFGISDRNIRCDKISGKTFNRREYNALVGTTETAPLLRKGDLLVIVLVNYVNT